MLRDKIPEERNLGIEAGLLWGECAEKTVMYEDYGVTEGMRRGIKRARELGRLVEVRTIGRNVESAVESKDHETKALQWDDVL